MPNGSQVSAVVTGPSSDLVGELVDRRQRLVENPVKKQAERRPLHDGGQPETPVNGLADPGRQTGVQDHRRRGRSSRLLTCGDGLWMKPPLKIRLRQAA